MTDGTKELPKWIEVTVKLDTPDGEREIIGLAHPYVPGLAVTMHQFGLFDVTHIATGKRAVGPWERCGGACLALAELGVCADWTQPVAEIREHLERHGAEPCGIEGTRVISGGVERAMTKRELFDMTRNWISGDEFPCEDSDDDPFVRADRIVARLAPAAHV